MKSRQSGITLIGFLLVLAVAAFFGYMAMKLVPSYSEYMSVGKSMSQLAADGTEGKTLDEIRRELIKKMDFQYVDDAAVKPSDITIAGGSGDGGHTLNVSYDKQVHFMYNIDFLLHFEKSVPLSGNVAQ